MKRTVAVLAAIAVSGCAHMDVASLVTSEASLACDWGQTRSAAVAGWHGYAEENSIIGPNPSAMRVDMYFATAAILDAAVWLVLPKGWRSAPPVALTVMEAKVIHGNEATTAGVCGVRI